MKLCKPLFEIWEQSAGLEGVYKQIEKVGRVCYKSEDKITEDSAKPFVNRMIKSGHGAILEHGTVYLFCSTEEYVDSNGDVQYYNPLEKYQNNNYSALVDSNEGIYVTTNLRVLVENGWIGDLQYLCEPSEFHESRVTVHFVCDRDVSHEFVRHRVMSFAQESIMYCNYSKDKFDNELTFIIPNWVNTNCPTKEKEGPSIASIKWSTAMSNAEDSYMNLIKMGCIAQEARAVLPNSLKTELVVTGFVSDWKHFFELRCDSAAHPMARELACSLKEEFIKRNYINCKKS